MLCLFWEFNQAHAIKKLNAVFSVQYIDYKYLIDQNVQSIILICLLYPAYMFRHYSVVIREVYKKAYKNSEFWPTYAPVELKYNIFN
jgi:hypothetical protein